MRPSLVKSWRPALRMARRDLWRHKGRTALTMLLVALPVFVGVAAAQFHHNTRWEGERAARSVMGGADALVQITPFERTRVRYWPSDMSARAGSFTRDDQGKRRPVRRDPSSVELAALLPTGSRVTPALSYVEVALASGGVGHVKILDASDPMAPGLASVSVGKAPRARDDVALGETAADELGLLDQQGRPRPDAFLGLLDGTRLRVVGVIDANADTGSGGVEMLAAPGSIVAEPERSLSPIEPSHRYLVDLPDSVGPAPHALARSLAAAGVAMLPRDVTFHPGAWRVQAPPPAPVDPTSLAIGALVVLFGLLEVVLIVGSAFAVGARRQVRDLGLVAASGGAPADVRRVLLAQGLVLGAGASVLAGAAGVLAFRLGTPLYEQLTHQPIWSRELDWLAIVGVTLLGSLTGLVAALVPSWSIGRLTPVAALSGRFPIRPGESRAHLPAFALAGFGLVLLLLGGWWTSREFAPPPAGPIGDFYVSPSSLPVVVGVLGLLVLIGGVVWATPYVVRRVAGLGRLLPLPGRFAFRDAARHRFRTAAAVVTLTVTVAGVVFAGFVVQAAAADMSRNDVAPPHSIAIYFDQYGPVAAPNPVRLERAIATIHDVLGPVETLVASRITRADRDYAELMLGSRRGGFGPVRVLDEPTFKRVIGAHNPAALQAFRDGALVTEIRQPVRDGRAAVALYPGARRPENRWTLEAVVVRPDEALRNTDVFQAWVSEDTAHRMGLVAVPSGITVLTDRPVTSEDLARLAVHGIEGWSPDTDLEVISRIRLGVLAGAGVLTLLVVGIAVALSAAEGRADQATMAAVGAGPWRRRSLGAMHGLFLAIVGVPLGLGVGIPAGAMLLQVDGAPGVAVPWLAVTSVLLAVPLLGWTAGWLATSTRLTLVRRTG